MSHPFDSGPVEEPFAIRFTASRGARRWTSSCKGPPPTASAGSMASSAAPRFGRSTMPDAITRPGNATYGAAIKRMLEEWNARKGPTVDAKRATVEVRVPTGERPWV